MRLFFRSRSAGTSAKFAAFTLVVFSTPGLAETVMTVNGAEIDSVMVDMYLESRIQRPADQATSEERDVVLQELTDIYLLTTQPGADQMRNDPRVKAQMELSTRGILAQAVAGDFLAKNAATEAEIVAEYEEQMKLAPTKQFKARHILVETQAAAADLITKLQAGEDFAELAKANSTGPTGPGGGDLGWFAPDQMVQPFSQAVVALEDGAFTTEPVQTQFGWHVILREESRDNQPPTLESVRDMLKQRVEQSKFSAYLETLRTEHTAQ